MSIYDSEFQYLHETSFSDLNNEPIIDYQDLIDFLITSDLLETMEEPGIYCLTLECHEIIDSNFLKEYVALFVDKYFVDSNIPKENWTSETQNGDVRIDTKSSNSLGNLKLILGIVLFIAGISVKIYNTFYVKDTSQIKQNHIQQSQYDSFILTEIPKKKESQRKMMLINGSQISPFIEKYINNHLFQVAYNDNGDTIYWSTYDSGFKTPEGYSVNMYWIDIPRDLQATLITEPGWAHIIALPSKWHLAFCRGIANTGKLPDDSTKIEWIYKEY